MRLIIIEITEIIIKINSPIKQTSISKILGLSFCNFIPKLLKIYEEES